MRQTTHRLLPTLLVAAVTATATAQTTHFVDGNAPPGGDGLSWPTAYDTLPPALTTAQPGDQVWVAAGTYMGNFTLALEVEMYGGFAGTETELNQRDWIINETTLDANGSGTVVTAPPGATEATRIDGFTITNGDETNGGGLSVVDSSPTITNNTVTGNFVLEKGGGLYLSGSAATVESNTFSGNHAVHNGGGGGVYLVDSSPMIRNNAITNNTVGFPAGGSAPPDDHSPRGTGAMLPGPPPGGGLHIRGNSSPWVIDNVISGNQGANSGGGVAGYLDAGGSPTITGNTISGNAARFWGGGLNVYADVGASVTITHNTINGNSVYWSGYGGGLHVSGSATVANNTIAGNIGGTGGGINIYEGPATVANNTIVGNTATNDGGGGLNVGWPSPHEVTITNTLVAFNSSGFRLAEEGIVSLRHNCVFGNTDYDYAGITDPTGTDGNISVGPSLLRIPDPGPDELWGTEDDDYGDLHLSTNSPAIDAGDNGEVPPDLADLDGDGDTTEPIPFDLDGWIRFVDAPLTPDTGSGSPPVVDIGAYEFQDCNGNGIADPQDIANGTSQDCAGEGRPDECERDCNYNGAADSCDILDGTSADNNANAVPDECDVSPRGEDRLNLPCSTDEQCDPPGAVCVQDSCYVPKNRYISIDPNLTNDGVLTARRVRLDDLGAQTYVLGWVGEPIELTIAGPEPTPQLIARIVSAPHYRDWSVDNGGQPWVDATVHVGDCETSPGQTYLVDAIVEGMDIGDEANYSAALMLPTVSNFGDVVGATIGAPSDGVRNFKDISAAVRGFQSIQTEPKVSLDLQGGTATPEIPDFSDINFGDINQAVSGFQGGSYPFPAPCDCPGQSCP